MSHQIQEEPQKEDYYDQVELAFILISCFYFLLVFYSYIFNIPE